MDSNKILLFSVLCFGPVQGVAQITLSGQVAADFLKTAPTQSQMSVNAGRPSFGWEADLFADVHVADRVSVLGTLRFTEDEVLNVDFLAIRLTDVTPLSLNIQAGKFDLPFGSLGERRYPRKNPFFRLPLIHEYRTALPDHITTETALAASKGQGSGMRLLDLGMYDLGAMIFGSFGILDYAFAVSSGTVSVTSYGNQNSNSDLGKVFRLALTPMTGFTIGAAYSWGAYLEEPDQPPPREVNVNTYQQKSAEIDIEFSRGHLVVNAQGVYNTWSVPLETRDVNLSVFGHYIEGRYTILPGLYLALRSSSLLFADAILNGINEPWDYDVTEWEFAAGYFIDRNVLLKLVRVETRTHGGSNPKDNLTALQLAVAF
jgi:hypothetical protein